MFVLLTPWLPWPHLGLTRAHLRPRVPLKGPPCHSARTKGFDQPEGPGGCRDSGLPAPPWPSPARPGLLCGGSGPQLTPSLCPPRTTDHGHWSGHFSLQPPRPAWCPPLKGAQPSSVPSRHPTLIRGPKQEPWVEAEDSRVIASPATHGLCGKSRFLGSLLRETGRRPLS